MAQRGSKMGLALVFIAITWACSSAQPTCQPPIVSLQPCFGFITSNSSTPTPQCCTQLANLVQTQAQCLCTFLNANPQLPFNINRTQAITLPGACNIQAPPLSQCNVAAPTGPSVPAAGSPQGAQTPASPATPTPTTPTDASAPAPSGVSPPSPSTPSATGIPASKGGSKAGPTKGQQSSSARISTKFTPSLFFFLLVASALSSF